nr:MAG TPA: hypothetical protein [Caudoviricetes sp.]
MTISQSQKDLHRLECLVAVSWAVHSRQQSWYLLAVGF